MSSIPKSNKLLQAAISARAISVSLFMANSTAKLSCRYYLLEWVLLFESKPLIFFREAPHFPEPWP